MHKAYSAQPIAATQTKYDRLTPDSIDKLNARAADTYLANPVYGRQLASKALVASKYIGYQKGIGQSSFYIGKTYWAQSYYSISLLYIDTALRYVQKDDRLFASDCYRYIGRNCTDLKDYQSSLAYLTKALQFAGTDKKRNEDALSELSYLYMKQKQFDKAYTLANQALKICRELNDTREEPIVYSRFVNVYVGKEQYGKALAYCDTTIKMGIKVNNKRLLANAWVSRSIILLGLNKNIDAISYAKQGLALGDSLGVMDVANSAYKQIIKIYAGTHDTKQLIYYQDKYNTFLMKRYMLSRQTNSMLMRDYFELNNRLQNINQVKQNARENDVRIRAQQQVITVLIISLLLLITALYIVWFYYKQKNAIAQRLREQYIATLAQSQIIEDQSKNLEELNNFKSKLLAIIGHDLRGPINNLRNVTDMFEDGSFSADEVHLLMKNINPVVKGAELTLSNLLVWADGQIRGIKSTQTTPVNLLKVIEQTEEICKSDLDKKHIHIHHNATMDADALVDENHLKVIFSNLINNAIKFTNGDGDISIRVNRENEKVVISVSDTGIGMSAEEVEKLLSVNTHFSKPGTQGETGTGIGLLLCRELIEINGGKLWLTSNLGKGTTFYFSLPAADLQVA